MALSLLILHTPISQICRSSESKWLARKIEVALIGSCTNSSYEDISRSASIAKHAMSKGLKAKANLLLHRAVNRFGIQLKEMASLDTLMKWAVLFWPMPADLVLVNGQDILMILTRKNTIITSFNRNFAKRNDGLASTHAFVASPEIVTAFAIAGDLTFNPLTDKLKNENGEEVMLDEPTGYELPPKGFAVEDAGYQAPAEDGSHVQVVVDPEFTTVAIA